jgi:non-specific serine/threonine protein kinase
MVGTTISHYQILEKLGAGGMGVVYKAEDTKLKRHVAIKFLPADLSRNEEAKRRFVREAQAASALDHPNICTIYEIDETEDGRMFICMACYEGETLKRKIERGPLDMNEALDIVVQAGGGLVRAHGHGIVHRDIKPANLFVTKEGQVKILDFGLAKLSWDATLSKTGTRRGTIAYMSPEQTRGEGVDHRTDVWSLGVVLYEMLTGVQPFKGDYEQAIVYSILNEQPELITDLRSDSPVELERIVEKAMAKSLSERYQQVSEMLADLRTLSKEQETRAAKEPLARSGAGRKSIAVLPFRNMVAGPENEWFSDGLTEDILTQLSKIDDLRVISRTSVMLYKDSKKNLREIGKELGVATILEGSVRRAGDRVRIGGQLIDARTDEHIWAETYDREMRDIFDIQSDVAQNIAVALRAKLSPKEKERIERKPTENLTAYDCYLKGREYYYRYSKENNEIAIGFFKKALNLDPDYALAHAGLADAYSQGVEKFGFTPTWVDRALELAERAILINPDCAEAHKALGLAYQTKGWLRKAVSAYQKAVELNPNYDPAVYNMGKALFDLGRYAEALRWIKSSISLTPTWALAYANVGNIYCNLCEYGKAELWLRKALELQPNLTLANAGFVYIYLVQSKYDQAMAHSRKVLSIDNNDPYALMCAADAQLFSHHFEKAEEYLQRAIEITSGELPTMSVISTTTRLAHIYVNMEQKDKAGRMLSEGLERAHKRLEQDREGWHLSYEIAAINALQGRTREACKWLQNAVAAGWRDSGLGASEPAFESLHGDEEFKQIMREISASVDEMRKSVVQDDQRDTP